MTRLGEGTHTYEWVEGWAKLPEEVVLGYTHGVVTDREDRVYIHNQSPHAVVILDRDGHYQGAWGEDFAAGAHGLYLSRENGDEYLYLSDYARHLVVKATLDGRVIYTLGVPPLPDVYPTEDLYKPTDACVAPNGDVYVCDGYGQSWVHRYDAAGEYLGSWGGKGSEPGQLNCPHGIWIDTRGDEPVVLVADRGNVRIQIFSLAGEHLGFVTDELRYPCCFFEHEGDLVVPDLHARVTIFDDDNRLITHLGDQPGVWQTEGWPNLPDEAFSVGLFSSPHAACVDSRGDLYVVEWTAKGRVTKLARV